MNRIGVSLLTICAMALLCGSANAVILNVDSAPNAYGSPAYAPWLSAAQDDVVAGTFQNMRNGTFPNTTTADPIDEIVYSTGDLGKRMHWIYWVPDESTTSLDGRFEVKWVIDWAGVDYTYDWDNSAFIEDGPEVGWYQPGSWADYDNGLGDTGVIGTFGQAFWAADDDAEPLSTDGNAYNETDAADIAALRATLFSVQTFATGHARINDGLGGDWEYTTLRVDIVPEPTSLVLLGLGSLVLLRRKRA